jgi:hypothetical protein
MRLCMKLPVLVLGPHVGFPLCRGTNEDWSEPCAVLDTSKKISARPRKFAISTFAL